MNFNNWSFLKGNKYILEVRHIYGEQCLITGGIALSIGMEFGNNVNFQRNCKIFLPFLSFNFTFS